MKYILLDWLVFVVLFSCVGWLVWRDMTRSSSVGLICNGQCIGLEHINDSFDGPSKLKMSHRAYSSNEKLQPAKSVQVTAQVQKTKSASALHEFNNIFGLWLEF